MCKYIHMATNLALDDRLIEEARRVGRHKTKREAVSAALAEYVKRRKQLRVSWTHSALLIRSKIQLQGRAPSEPLVMVLVDTSVWSLALRRKPTDLSPAERALTRSLRELVGKSMFQMSALSARNYYREYETSRTFVNCASTWVPSTIPSLGWRITRRRRA